MVDMSSHTIQLTIFITSPKGEYVTTDLGCKHQSLLNLIAPREDNHLLLFSHHLAEQPKSAIYPHKLDYCEKLQSGNASSDEIKSPEKEISGFSTRPQRVRSRGSSTLQEHEGTMLRTVAGESPRTTEEEN